MCSRVAVPNPKVGEVLRVLSTWRPEMAPTRSRESSGRKPTPAVMVEGDLRAISALRNIFDAASREHFPKPAELAR